MSRSDGPGKYRFTVLHPSTANELTDDVLIVVGLKSLLGLVAFEEMKDAWVFGVSR